jgi:hypothetical protein
MKRNLKCLFFACCAVLSYGSFAETIFFKSMGPLSIFSNTITRVESCLQQPFVNNDFCLNLCTADPVNSQQDCEVLRNSFAPVIQSQNRCMAYIRTGADTAYENLLAATEAENLIAPNLYCIQQALPYYSPPSLRMIY